MSIDIRLSRMDRVYRPGEKVAGNVVITVNKGTPLSHEGVHITAEGSASLQLSAKSVGLFEAFYSSIKPTQLFHHTKELKPSGKIPDGRHSLPFEFEIKQTGNEKLLESYHGVYINIQYVITAEIKKGMLSKNMKRSVEFIMEVPEQRVPKEQPSPFAIVPESLENVRKSALSRLPTFKIGGQIDSVVCNITQPFSGEVTIEECSATIKSIELQLVRVETCSYADGMAREATEIQNIQIADGSICHGWPIPIHMIFPRLFTCPTVLTRTFKVEFEVNLVILFHDGHLLTENFPLKLLRSVGT
uniref:Vacuolar protein sorting-associated protein 26C n=1 Tax=Haptolina ericina TaxID=156174 RepID=A0A7S3EX03_9EUKA|mmetsp:Transcript_28192/g.63812  ORF Transcript_28192/g.63812 Transcript_28192/m.63812 type:complete len:302 (+) Transcript_28192:23-928(+)